MGTAMEMEIGMGDGIGNGDGDGDGDGDGIGDGDATCVANPALNAVDPGRGIRCSKLIRCVMELLGVRDVTAKVIGNKNPYSVIQALFSALSRLQDHGTIRAVRGLDSLAQLKRVPPYTARLPEGFDAVKTPQNIQRLVKELNLQ